MHCSGFFIGVALKRRLSRGADGWARVLDGRRDEGGIEGGVDPGDWDVAVKAHSVHGIVRTELAARTECGCRVGGVEWRRRASRVGQGVGHHVRRRGVGWEASES